tara:strand:- start:459 stop:1064 length:606 start_codon:yes stop_codon:yes gene_type:complete
MPYGYLGTDKDQTVSNAGVLSISELADLEKRGKLGGSLEKIETITSSSTSTMDFTDLKDYKVHVIQFYNFRGTGTATSAILGRVSTDGGSSFLSTSIYKRAFERQRPDGSTTILDGTHTSLNSFFAVDTDYASSGGWAIFFNLLDSTKDSLVRFQASNGVTDWQYVGSFGIDDANTHNAIRITTNNEAFAGSATLYGWKQI